MTSARVLSFHVDSDELDDVTEALDGVTEQFSRNPDFRGLLCLEHGGLRHEIVILTLWDGDGLEATRAESEVARARIAATTDLGVSSKCFEVLRLVDGSVPIEARLAEMRLAEVPAASGRASV
jgi:hypothetical protein